MLPIEGDKNIRSSPVVQTTNSFVHLQISQLLFVPCTSHRKDRTFIIL